MTAPARGKPALRRRQEQARGAARARHPDAGGRLAALFNGVRSRLGGTRAAGPRAVVAGYWPIRSEISPLALMAELARDGLATALPVTPEPGGALEFRLWQEGDALVAGPHGTSEPGAGAPAATPDMLLVPLLAFDDSCHRLGYGGGFYDRTIAALRAAGPGVVAVGLAYGEQRVARLPVEAHDAALDAVLTPDGVFWGPGLAAASA